MTRAVLAAALLSLACATACSLHVDSSNTLFACGSGDTCAAGFTCVDDFCLPDGSGSSGSGSADIACAGGLATGGDHTCTIRSDGTVWCWGRNDSGQLGDGTLVDRATPVQVMSITGAIAIGAGPAHTCAATATAVFCWGHNDSGQLGNASTLDSQVPVQAVDVTKAKALALGDEHSCALLVDGTVSCWGRNDFGQLGDGSNAPHPPSPAKPTTVVALAAHADTTCAALADGSTMCWGNNDAGQLVEQASSSSLPVPILSVTSATQLALGVHHACALVAGGAVTCWGDNSFGELGNGLGTGSSGQPSAPVIVALPVAATSISAGDVHTCATDAQGGLWCWGDNVSGELGDGSANESQFAPVRAQSTGVDASSGGTSHTCVHHADGALDCFGADLRGQLGDGTPTSRITPNPVAGLGSNVVGVTAGGQHTCAWLGDGSVQCWGANDDGELGDGTRIQHDTPAVALASGVASVGAGEFHTCATLANGAAECWGRNSSTQLGDGSNEASFVPVDVAFTGEILDVVAGDSFSCALTGSATNNVACWGTNQDGEIGANVPSSTSPPVLVFANSATEVAAGFDFACALSTTEGVVCWGNGGRGQDGNGGEGDAFQPVTALGPGAATAVVAGQDFACALAANSGSATGGVECWGVNSAGQLGNAGVGGDRDQAVAVGTLATAVAVYAGGETACARLADNSLWCWGASLSGVIHGYTPYNTPIQVLAPSATAFDVVLGDAHACMVQDGAVACWGDDTRGELGDGVASTTAARSVVMTCPAM